jgi:hypothetical protein
VGATDRRWGHESELYDDRLVRMLAMRRTMFVATVEDVPVLHAAASLAVAREQRKRNEELVAMLGVADVERWIWDAETATLAALEQRGEQTAQELAKDVPALRQKVRVNIGKRYEGDIGMSSRVLLLLAAEGRIVRGRPRGTWISSQYRWAPMDRWLGHPLPELPVAQAQADLVWRWLARFGPGTEADIRWWTGWTARETRAALASVETVEVDLGGSTGLVMRDDLDATPAPAPWVALLPALDATTMGWQARDWYLGDHRRMLFDANGNAGPTIWCDGRIVGGWAVRADGQVVAKLLEDVGRERATEVDAESACLTAWLRGCRSSPLPTPLHRASRLIARWASSSCDGASANHQAPMAHDGLHGRSRHERMWRRCPPARQPEAARITDDSSPAPRRQAPMRCVSGVEADEGHHCCSPGPPRVDGQTGRAQELVMGPASPRARPTTEPTVSRRHCRPEDGRPASGPPQRWIYIPGSRRRTRAVAREADIPGSGLGWLKPVMRGNGAVAASPWRRPTVTSRAQRRPAKLNGVTLDLGVGNARAALRTAVTCAHREESSVRGRPGCGSCRALLSTTRVRSWWKRQPASSGQRALRRAVLHGQAVLRPEESQHTQRTSGPPGRAQSAQAAVDDCAVGDPRMARQAE